MKMKRSGKEDLFEYIAQIPSDSIFLIYTKKPDLVADQLKSGTKLAKFLDLNRITGIVLNADICDLEILTDEELEDVGLKRIKEEMPAVTEMH